MKKALLLKTAAALALATPMVSMAESQLAAQGANSTLALEALQDDEKEVDGEDSL